MATLFAQPYDISATGFCFESYEEYEEKSLNNRGEHGQPIEEYEIQYIDGDNGKLFELAGVNQANLEEWFKEYADLELSNNEMVALEWLVDDIGKDIGEALGVVDEVNIFEGTREDYAMGLVDDAYDLPEIAQRYFDYDALGRDMELGGQIVEVGRNLWITNPHDF